MQIGFSEVSLSYKAGFPLHRSTYDSEMIISNSATFASTSSITLSSSLLSLIFSFILSLLVPLVFSEVDLNVAQPNRKMNITNTRLSLPEELVKIISRSRDLFLHKFYLHLDNYIQDLIHEKKIIWTFVSIILFSSIQIVFAIKINPWFALIFQEKSRDVRISLDRFLFPDE